jgi:outer membrane protein insertion porin family
MRSKLAALFGFILLYISVAGQVNLGELDELNYANPKQYSIGGITVSGIQFLDNNVLIMLSGLSVGDMINVPGEEISNAIHNLWDQGLFENVKITVTDIQNNIIFLNIDLKERPRLSSFSFGGIKKAEVDKIREEIKLSRGDVVTANLLLRTEAKIKKYYTDKGYLDVEIDMKQIPDSTRANHVSLHIELSKNERIKISTINIEGNTYLRDDKIKRFLKETKEKGTFKPFADVEGLIINNVKNLILFRPQEIENEIRDYINKNMKMRIFKSSKLIKENFEEDKLTLINRYNEFGYRDAKIVKDSVYRNPDKTVNIDLVIEEGNRYYFRDIAWVGNTIYPDAFLNRVLRIQKGDVYNWDLLISNLTFNASEDDVTSLYMNDGYLFFSANPVEVSVENDSIDIQIRVHEGKQATIKNISVSGNTRTNDHVIVRELRTRPGQLFSRSDIIRTTRELAQLMYFDPQKINPQVNPNPAEGTVDIEYEVVETSSDQVELSGGWGYGRVIGTLGVSFNNFSLKNVFKPKAWRPVPTGDGQKLSLRLQSYGKGYISYSASFTEPWLGGKKPNSFSVSYYHSLYSNGLLKGDPDRQSFVTNGITVGLGRRLTWPDDFFTLYTAFNFQKYDLDNYGRIFSFGNGSGTYNNFTLAVTLGRSSIDQRIFPTQGSDIALSLEVTPPYSAFSTTNYALLDDTEKYKWMEYHKWGFHASYYTPAFDKFVIMARAKFGFLGYMNPDIGVTPFERYYLGGDGLSGYNNLDGREIIGMRGYGNETLTPDYWANRNQGGTIYTKYTMELRYPLSLNPNATIFVATFLEAGNSWSQFSEFNPFGVYKAAGFGVRVFLPMFGILGLDWGYGFNDVPGLPDAARGQFHFSINQSID